MNEDKRNDFDEKINTYKDPTNLTPKNLKWGLWIASNKERLYRILVVILALIAFSTTAYALYGIIEYNTIGREREKILLYSSGGIDISDYREQNRPTDLKVGLPQAVSGSQGTDLIVRLSNVNEKQHALFNYCFVVGEDEVCGQDFILPNEEKDLLFLNSDLRASADIKFVIKRILWQKLKAYEVPDWSVYRNQRLNFEIEGAKFTTYINEAVYLEFTIKNSSPFSYHAVPLNIIIRQGDRVLATNRYVVFDFLSRSTRDIRLLWSEEQKRGSSIEIIPVLNILDNSIYKPYTAVNN